MSMWITNICIYFFLCKYVYILTFDLFISVSNCVHTDHILQIYDPLIFTYTLG